MLYVEWLICLNKGVNIVDISIDEVAKLYPEHRKFYAVVFEYPYDFGGLESIWSSNELALWRIGELNSVKGIKPDYHVEEHWLDELEPGDEVEVVAAPKR